MMRIRPEKPRRSHSMRWPSTSFAHHSPSAGWNSSAGTGSADSSAWIVAAADCRSAATAGGGRGPGVIAWDSKCRNARPDPGLVADDELGDRDAGAEAAHQVVGLELDTDRVAVEGGGAHPGLPLLGGGEVVDLQLHPVAVG